MTYEPKYLYGKYKNLKDLIFKGEAIWFTDINYYTKLENEKIRDNESQRVFQYDGRFIKSLQMGEHIIPGKDIKKLKINHPTRRAHVLCLSNDGYKPELYKRFDANVCIKIDVEVLMDLLVNAFEPKKGEVITRNVEYFGLNYNNTTIDNTSLVFYKSEIFQIENEYRIAIFYPYDSSTYIKITKNKRVKVFGDEYFIKVGYPEPPGMQIIIKEAYNKNGNLIFKNEHEYVNNKNLSR